jgi:ketosteroid isomerase-like protein
MSQENVEIVRRGFDAYNRRDVDGFLAYLDQEFELHSAIIGGADATVYRGHDGVRRWLADSDAGFDELTVDPSEFRDLGDRVLMLGRIRARGRKSGLKLDSTTGWVCTIRGGKIAEARGFLNPAEALEAAGLAE